MKKNLLSLTLAWALALIASTITTNLNAASVTTVTRANLVINNAPSDYGMISFQITDAPRGARVLIQVRGFAAKGMDTLDPEIRLYAETKEGLTLLAGNDDWRSNWSDGPIATPSNQEAVTLFQDITGAFELTGTDSALAVIASNGNFALIVGGWRGSTGLADISIHVINEAPKAPQIGILGSLDVAVGAGIFLSVVSSDPDNDEVEFLFDLDNDGVVDIVSPRRPSNIAFWPKFLRCEREGEQRFTIWARDSKGAVSVPLSFTVNGVPPVDQKG